MEDWQQQHLQQVLSNLLGDTYIVDVEKLPDTNWLQENQQQFPAMRLGRFYIYGSHIKQRSLAGYIPLHIDSATAFGSGNHESTVGCLQAMEWLYKKGLRPQRILDVGCGSAILAMAAAKIFKNSNILAVDYDKESVRVSKNNIRKNRVPHIRVACAKGYRPPVNSPYQLIFSNILSKPLCELAPAMQKHLAPGGYNISAGLLIEQSNQVEQVYRKQGLKLQKRISLGEWQTLVFKN